jgi:hypothetical protein
LVDRCRISCEPGSRKRRFSQLREKLYEKNEAASHADSDNQAKHFVRKTGAFTPSTFGNEAVKTAQSTQENLCEKNACHTYKLSEPHKPIPGMLRKVLREKITFYSEKYQSEQWFDTPSCR